MLVKVKRQRQSWSQSQEWALQESIISTSAANGQFLALALTFNGRCFRELARHVAGGVVAAACVGQVSARQHVVNVTRSIIFMVFVVVGCPVTIDHKLVENSVVRSRQFNSLFEARSVVLEVYSLLPVVECARDEDFARWVVPAQNQC